MAYIFDKDGNAINPATSDLQIAATEAQIATTEAVATPSVIVADAKQVTSTTAPEALVADSTPCKMVWIGAPCDANGAAINTKTAFIGSITTQNIPLLPTNFEGYTFQVSNAATIYIDIGANNESVNYAIFS